jgi:hypothetical protein
LSLGAIEAAIAELEERPPGPVRLWITNEDEFLISFLRTLNRLAKGHGITSPYLGMACEQVERQLRPNTIDRHVGWRIQHRRREIGMQREALAKAVGITDDELRQYEWASDGSSPRRSGRSVPLFASRLNMCTRWGERKSSPSRSGPSVLNHSECKRNARLLTLFR